MTSTTSSGSSDTSVRAGTGPVSPQELAGDHQSLDLVGPLEDLRDLGFPHVALGREVAGVAIPAQHLDRIGRDPHGRIGRDHLGHRRVPGERLAGVALARRIR